MRKRCSQIFIRKLQRNHKQSLLKVRNIFIKIRIRYADIESDDDKLDEDQQAAYDQWKNSKDQQQKELMQQALERQLEEYERMYIAKEQTTFKFLKSPVF
jgi:hypothetical protein